MKRRGFLGLLIGAALAPKVLPNAVDAWADKTLAMKRGLAKALRHAENYGMGWHHVTITGIKEFTSPKTGYKNVMVTVDAGPPFYISERAPQHALQLVKACGLEAPRDGVFDCHDLIGKRVNLVTMRDRALRFMRA